MLQPGRGDALARDVRLREQHCHVAVAVGEARALAAVVVAGTEHLLGSISGP